MKRTAASFLVLLVSVSLNIPVMMAESARIPGNPDMFRRIDSMISTGRTAEEMAGKAMSLFDFFTESSLAGDENYAVYIARNYFMNRHLPADTDRLTAMNIYCRLNENSLTGMPAAGLKMKTPSLEDVYPDDVHSRYTILYFYDAGCRRCLAEIPVLTGLASREDITGTDIYAIYTGTDIEEWQGFIGNRLGGKGLDTQVPSGFNSDSIRFFNAADPSMESGFHVLYGVIQTPETFVIDSDGFILGRKIDLNTAAQMISDDMMFCNSLQDYISTIYETARPSGYDEACYFADRFIKESEGDDHLKRRTVRMLFDKFAESSDYEEIMASHYIAGKYIAGDSVLWKEDIREEAAKLVEKAGKNPIGDTIASLTVYDAFDNPVNIRDNGGKYSVIYFYSLDCPVCRYTGETMERLKEKYPAIRFLEIYTGTEFYRWAEENFHKDKGIQLQDCGMKSDMFRKFDLETVPAIYITGPDNVILAKEIGPATLTSVLEETDRFLDKR